MPQTPRDAQLTEDLTWLKEAMIAAATHREQIPDINDRFQRTYARVASALARRKIENPLPFGDLWDWYSRWRSGDLPSYESRRVYVRNLFDPLIRRLQTGVEGEFSPTGWARVDRNVEEFREVLGYASTEEQFQTVGLLCREALISLAQVVYDPSKHVSEDGVAISETDAMRMLESYISHELRGASEEETRKHIRSALGLAASLQHRRTANFRAAAMCAEATTTVINLVAIVSGIRDPRDEEGSDT